MRGIEGEEREGEGWVNCYQCRLDGRQGIMEQ